MLMTEMARTRLENADSCPKMDTTWRNEAGTTGDNMAEDSNGRATSDGGLMGRGSGRSKGQALWRSPVVG